jgi:hypothetical protein
VLKTFKKNYGKNSEEFKLLSRMMYSITEEEYLKHLVEFKNITSQKMVKYFDVCVL